MTDDIPPIFWDSGQVVDEAVELLILAAIIAGIAVLFSEKRGRSSVS